MTDLTKLKELAERAADDFGSFDPSEAEQDFMEKITPRDVLGLIAEVERLNDELSACTEHPGGCGYWRDAAKYRAKERDVFAQELESFKQANRNLSESNVRRREDNARLKTENEALRQFAAEAYQVLGALDAPENVLDNASDAAGGAPLRHKTLLPFFAEGYEALRKDAERYRWLRDLPRGTSHGDLTIMLAKNRPAPNQWCTDTIRGEALDAAIDAALEGGWK